MTLVRRQRGAALIALVAVLVLAVVAGILAFINSALNRTTGDRNRNAEVLQQAKTALIGYVAKEVLDLSNRTPGRFPCPEGPGAAGNPDTEGIAAASCDPSFPVNKTVGRLPWRTLGLDKLVDSHAEPLWYAVSPNWVFSGTYPVLNSGTPGQLTVDGTPGVVAIIIAPGAPLAITPSAAQLAAGCVARNQGRSDRSHVDTVPAAPAPDYRDYLECENASSPVDAAFGTSVIDNATNAVVNDQLIYITASDILNAIQGPLAERLQRTVAPLLSEFSAGWVSGGTILPSPVNNTLPRLMPYAFPFVAPEAGTAVQDHCGSAASPTTEGLLPIASMALTGACASPWGNFSWSGSIGGATCNTDFSGAASCQFTYYTLRSIGGVNLFQILGLTSPASTSVTLQATAPNVASTFRRTLAATDISINPVANISSATFTQLPNPTNGSANLALQLQITRPGLCVDTPPPLTAPTLNIVCSTLGLLSSVCAQIPVISALCPLLGALLNEALTTPHDVTVQFPALSNPSLQGTQLSASVMDDVVTPLSLLSPVSRTLPERDDPHYWFFSNQWYRYTYYAVSPSASAAQTAGSHLIVNGFPPELGGPNDKRFVLAVMGPAANAQTRGAAAGLVQYLEGENASTGDNVFAFQVFDSLGNDRIAGCPATSTCD